MSDEPSETILIRFMVEAQDAIKKQQEVAAAINVVKTQLKELATQTNTTYKEMAAAMISSKTGELMAKAFPDKEQMANATVEIARYKEAMAGALKAIGVETATSNNIQTTASRNIIAQQKAEADAVKQAEQQEIQAKRDAAKEWDADSKQQTIAMKYLAQEGKTSADTTKSSFSSIAVGLAAAFGITAIGIVRQFFQAFIDYAKQAIQVAYDFVKSTFELQAGINAMRREGMDITFGEWTDALQKLKDKFKIFSNVDLVEGSKQLMLYLREGQLTTKQLSDLADASATFATLTGQSFADVAQKIGLAVSTGNIRGLYTLYFNITKTEESAEGLAKAFGTTFQKLTDAQREAVMYTLVMQHAADMSNDAAQMQNNLAGAIDTTTSAITDAKQKTGDNLLALKYLWEQLTLAVVNYFNAVSDVQNQAETKKGAISEFLSDLFGKDINLGLNIRPEIIVQWQLLVEQIQMAADLIKNWADVKEVINDFVNTAGANLLKLFGNLLDPLTSFEKKIQDIKQAWIDLKHAWGTLTGMAGLEKIFNAPTTPTLPKAPLGTKTNPPLNQDQIDAANKTAKDILDLETQNAIDRRDLAIDLQRDLAKIEKDGAAKVEDLADKHSQKMTDIGTKAADDISNAEAKYALDVQQAWDDYYSNVADAALKNSDKLLKIEEDYQEKLKKLKEGFLMDMEDALEKRDARQVLNLIRRYNLEKTQATRERDQNVKDENRAYQEQLKTLESQRNDRLKKLKEELALREAEIVKQRDRELDAEVTSYWKARDQQIWQTQQDVIDRKAKNKDDLTDLNTHLADRVKALADGLVNEGTVTAQGMQAFLDIINEYIGPGGRAEATYDYFVAYAQAAMAAAMGVKTKAKTSTTTPKTGHAQGGIEVTNPSHKSYATGGMEIANKPTTAVFGEAGPELHLFIPLTGSVSNLSAGSAPLPTMKTGAGGKGKLQVEILLESGLVGKIVDKAHDEMADIVFGSVRR